MGTHSKFMTVGAGTLTLGQSSLSPEAEITSATVTTSVKDGDRLDFLSGDSSETPATYSHSVKIKAVQNLTAKGFVGYLYANKGKHEKLVYTPNTADGAKFEGTVRLDPPDAGGDVGTASQVDIELKFLDFTFTPATKVNGQS